MNSVLNLQPIAQFLAEHLLNGVLGGTALALLAWALLRVIGGGNSRARFGVWFSVLLAIGGLPLLERVYASVGGAAAAPYLPHSTINLPESWAPYVFGIWAVVASVALLRLAFALWQLHQLRKQAAVVDLAALDTVLCKTLEEFQASRHVELRTSDRVHVPTAIGFFKPAIILPAWVIKELPIEQVHALLLHELAHLQRGDDWTNLIQKLLRAILFFHPAVWWIDSRLALEREMACDDIVLAQSANRRDYALSLVSVAEKSFFRRGLALAQAAVSRMRHLSMRVKQILGAREPESNRMWKPALSLAVVLSAAFVAWPRAPKLIAFEDSGLNVPVAAAPELNVTATASAKTAAVTSEDVQNASPVRVIPAAFKAPTGPRISVQKVSPSRRLSSVASKLEAALVARSGDGLIQPQATSTAQNVAPREAVFLVVRAEQDGNGIPRSWDLYVIQVTFPQNAQPVDTGASKKI